MARGYPDYEGQKSGLYDSPEWATIVGDEKNWASSGANLTAGQFATFSYTTPAGLTLYFRWAGGMIRAQDPANYDHFLYCSIDIIRAGSTVLSVGGIGGAQIILPSGFAVDAGVTIQVFITNRGNITCYASIAGWGYEI